METLLVHKDLMENGGVNALLIELQSKGVSINGGPRASSMLNLPSAPSYYHEYGSLACTIEMWMMCMLPLIIYTSMEVCTLIVLQPNIVKLHASFFVKLTGSCLLNNA